MGLHFTGTDIITTGTINNFENIDALPALQLCFLCGDFGYYRSTIMFNRGIKYLLLTISHKLDCKNQILCFSSCARCSSFADWLALLILFVYQFEFWNIQVFFNLENEFYHVSVLSCLACHTSDYQVSGCFVVHEENLKEKYIYVSNLKISVSHFSFCFVVKITLLSWQSGC